MKKDKFADSENWTEEDHFDLAAQLIAHCVYEARKAKPQFTEIHMAYALIQVAAMLSDSSDWPGFVQSVLDECVFMEHGE